MSPIRAVSHQQLLGNNHISMDMLSDLLADELRKLKDRMNDSVRLEPLDRLKEIADATTKALVRTRSGRPIAVVICSRPASPNLVSRGAMMAEQVRNLVGPRLGDAIIRPMSQGSIEGRSYIMLPYCRDLSSFKPVRIVQRLRLKRPLLTWLREATAAAVSASKSNNKVRQRFDSALRHLDKQKLFNGEIQAAVCTALDRIDSGQWNPQHTFDHNDMYLNNIMLPSSIAAGERPCWPFVLIDWVGANSMGFGIYDLVRLARALKLSASALQRELIAHSEALQCELQDTQGHLLAALGRLHQHIEHFPEDKYIRTVYDCWGSINKAIPSSHS